MKRQIDKRIKGPDEQARAKFKTHVRGEATNDRGGRVTARVVTANGYDMTINGALLALRRLLQYNGEGGYFTPKKSIGERFVEEIWDSGAITLDYG